MDTIIHYYWQIGLIGRIIFLLYLLAFSKTVFKLPLPGWEKMCWILLALVLPMLGVFIFYTFRNSNYLLKHSRKKFNPRFNKQAS